LTFAGWKWLEIMPPEALVGHLIWQKRPFILVKNFWPFFTDCALVLILKRQYFGT
jgi:hypothetical protein